MSQKNKNVIIMMTDQQRFDTIACLGNPIIKTPNLDRLAKRGVIFTHAFTPQPVCGPARHSIFTGVDSKAIGKKKFGKASWHPNGRFMTEVLAESGYRTGGFGKMHFAPTRAHHGFQHYKVHEEMDPEAYREDDDYLMYLKAHGYGHVRYPSGVRGLLYIQPQVSPIPEEYHETTWVANQAIEFINTFHRERFFLFVSWMQPHWPVNVPEPYASMYSIADIKMPVFKEDEILPWFSQMYRVASDMFNSGKPDSVERLKRSIALYYASISFIDKQIGRILNTLEEKGLIEDSLIIFTADHGELLGDHMSFTKVSAYEPSIHIPFIVSCPDIKSAGHPSDDFITHYDIAPTVYDFTGVEPPVQNKLVGLSLLSQREVIRQRNMVFFEVGDGSNPSDFVGVRTRRWKYAFCHAGPLRQLFDLDKDPHELNNLLEGDTSQEYLDIANNLHQELLKWNKQHGLPERFENGNFKVIPFAPIPPDRNSQYEKWIDYLSEDEKGKLWSEARSVYEAIKNEKYVDPANLDLEYWERKRGKGCISELGRLMGRKLRG